MSPSVFDSLNMEGVKVSPGKSAQLNSVVNVNTEYLRKLGAEYDFSTDLVFNYKVGLTAESGGRESFPGRRR